MHIPFMDTTQPYSGPELEAAQARYDLTFPPDLLMLLGEKPPARFYDWRVENPAIRRMLDWPVEALLFDVEHGSWLRAWGERPARPEDREAIVRESVAGAPPLIPLYSHRYLPALPALAGNPVLSMHGFDSIWYGADLADYLRHEFGDERYSPVSGVCRHVSFWSDLVEDRARGYEEA